MSVYSITHYLTYYDVPSFMGPLFTFQVISSDSVETVIHSSQDVNCSLCVHILFSGPDVHDGVIAVQPRHILSVMHSSCKGVQ